ncbi:alpha-glucuronidase [Bacillus sp. TS-2]|nr:alpha-glucuronidase [Bacillus sp. TS-2]
MTVTNELVSTYFKQTPAYKCWLNYDLIAKNDRLEEYKEICGDFNVLGDTLIYKSIKEELTVALHSMSQKEEVAESTFEDATLIISDSERVNLEDYGVEPTLFSSINEEGFLIKSFHNGERNTVLIIGKTDKGSLYGTYHFLRLLQGNESIEALHILNSPKNRVRMMNQWDNVDGSIERGYSGQSIFFENDQITSNLDRVKDYARLLASVGVNAISINNVNVWKVETHFITNRFINEIADIAGIFRSYGLKLFLSINFASPIELGDLQTADPLDKEVKNWWKEKAAEIYKVIPDFGGFVVKADSEHRPGPFSYDRNHADGANLLAEALESFGGIVVWRCFVYNCMQDWRDRKTDRAKAAYENFKPLDGKFHSNVILQVKNGPMDFQVREPVSPLFGALQQTNQVLEFQIAQEYLGQQKDLCFLVPMWKEVLDFDTYAKGEGSTVKKIVDGSLYDYQISGIAAVSNIGNDENWTGNTLAQANLYGYGRLIWDPDLTADEIATEWVSLTFGNDDNVQEQVLSMLMDSWGIYENYTTPLGIGWMINPHHHYGPNVDGYEYSRWGTYHFADRDGLGVDRTIETGTGYTAQYFKENQEIYNSLSDCPDEFLLFFHHVPYTHVLKSGETVIQHYYNSHFKGVEQVESLIEKWTSLEGKMEKQQFENVLNRLDMQLTNAKEWRDQVNTYFYRKSGIEDEKGRKIY